MKFFLTLFLSAIFIFTIYQAYEIYTTRLTAEERLKQVAAKEQQLQTENQRLAEDIRYYSNEHNAAKESVSQFNYRRPDEKLYIIIPAEWKNPF